MECDHKNDDILVCVDTQLFVESLYLIRLPDCTRSGAKLLKQITCLCFIEISRHFSLYFWWIAEPPVRCLADIPKHCVWSYHLLSCKYLMQTSS